MKQRSAFLPIQSRPRLVRGIIEPHLNFANPARSSVLEITAPQKPRLELTFQSK